MAGEIEREKKERFTSNMAGEGERGKKERFTSNMAGEGERGKKERFTNNKRRAFGPPFTNKNHPDAYKGLDFAKGHTH